MTDRTTGTGDTPATRADDVGARSRSSRSIALLGVVAAAAYLVWVAAVYGVLPTLAGIALSLPPVALVVLLLSWLLHRAPMPRGLLVAALGWGGVASGLSVLVYLILLAVFDVATEDTGRFQLMVAGTIEEALKGALVIGVVLVRGVRRLGHTVGAAYLSGAVFGAVEIAATTAIRLDTGVPIGLGTAYQEVLVTQSGITALTGLGAGVALGLRAVGRWLSIAAGLAAAIGLHTGWDVSAGAFDLGFQLRVPVFAALYLWLLAALVLALRERRALRRPDSS